MRFCTLVYQVRQIISVTRNNSWISYLEINLFWIHLIWLLVETCKDLLISKGYTFKAKICLTTFERRYVLNCSCEQASLRTGQWWWQCWSLVLRWVLRLGCGTHTVRSVPPLQHIPWRVVISDRNYTQRDIFETSRLLRFIKIKICLIFLHTHLVITARKWSLGQGNVFTPVCHSVHRGQGGLPTPLL